MRKPFIAAAAVVGLLVSSIGGAAGAATPQATMIARRFDDGLDSRFAGEEVAGALAALGYSSVAHTNGRSAADAWEDGVAANVFGAFGHGNAGIMQTDEGPTPETAEILAAGDLTDISAGNIWYWGNYLHYLDIDDMKLAIFAGCYTANAHPVVDSFGTVAEERGVDSIVGFTDLVYFPAHCTSCNYSGNYFWSRFAAYAKAGDTLANALSKARSDLTAKEGDAGGWQNWKLDGAVDRPGDVRLAPAAIGEEFNSAPSGIDPFDLLLLNPTRTRSSSVDGRQVVDTETAEGVAYRRDVSTGELIWLSAPTAVMGQSQVSEEQARDRAVAFAQRYVPGFSLDSGIVTTSAPTHEDGDLLYGFSWRLRVADRPGPLAVDIEVDRRTGAVTYFTAQRATPTSVLFTVSREQAIAAARAALEVPQAEVISVTSDIWTTPTWSVRFDRHDDGATPDYVVVDIDARTGGALGQRAT